MTDSEKEAFEIIEWAIYEPLFTALGIPLMAAENSKGASSVIEAKIRSGDLVYENGMLKGKFNASAYSEAKSMGLAWNPHLKAFTGAMTLYFMRIAMNENAARKEAYARLNEALAEIPARAEEIEKSLNLEIPAVKARDKRMELGISKISKEDLQDFKNGYNDGIKRAFKNFSEKEYRRIRNYIQSASIDNEPLKEIGKTLSERYEAGRERAKFWVRQETGLLVAGIENMAMAKIGVRWYIWKTVGDGDRVRDDHKKLNNTLQNADSPPLTNASEVARGQPPRYGNPKTDYNCRCHAIWLSEREVAERLGKR